MSPRFSAALTGIERGNVAMQLVQCCSGRVKQRPADTVGGGDGLHFLPIKNGGRQFRCGGRFGFRSLSHKSKTKDSENDGTKEYFHGRFGLVWRLDVRKIMPAVPCSPPQYPPPLRP